MFLSRLSRAVPAALFLWGALGLSRAAVAQVPTNAAAPAEAVIVLRNGNVLEGAVTEAGDFLIITHGRTELRLKTAEVEFWCRDLEEAFARKAAAMDRVGARCHLDLAEWCLRQKLVDRAAEQVVQAVRIEPDHPRIPLVEARLKLAVDSAADRPSPVSESPGEAAEAIDLDEWERELPRGTVDKFTTFVQPILLNRCATARCHGTEEANGFELTRPAAGALIQRRITQRNLYSAMLQTNRKQPEESRLLVLPLQAEGHGDGPVFDQKSRIQWEQLAAWVRLATRPTEPIAPASIVQPVTHLSQPGDEGLESRLGKEDTAENAVPPAAGDRSKTGTFTPRDPFDPEIFNRRMRTERAPVDVP